jgi:hypothetical protein
MKRLAYLVSAVLVLAWNPLVPANVAPPPKKPERVVAPVTIQRGAIRGEGRSVQAKIIIPMALVHRGGAGAPPPAPAPAGAAPTRGAAPPAAQPAPAAREQAALPLGTVIAGIAMSLAAVSLVFVVRGNRSTKTAALAVLAGALALGAYSAAHADLVPGRPVGPPIEPEIVIELVEDGDTVTLQIPR